MTNKEAIETIKANYPSENYTMLREALDMAIAALTKKIRPRPEKLLPCKCGSKRREHWCGCDEWNAYILKCCKCGLEAAGRNEIEAHKEWNKTVSKAEE